MNLFQKIYKNFIAEFEQQCLENFLNYVYDIMFASYVEKTLQQTRKSYFIKERGYKDMIVCFIPWEIPYCNSSKTQDEMELDVENMIEDVKLFNSFKSLTYKQKEVLYDFYLEDRSDIEISKKLNISRQAVHRMRLRAINSIKKSL